VADELIERLQDEPARQADGKLQQTRRSRLMATILAHLTETQKVRWDELIGRPFAAAGRIRLPGRPPLRGFAPPKLRP
jgi:hypothetical protein